jgi:hypothetical protein
MLLDRQFPLPGAAAKARARRASGLGPKAGAGGLAPRHSLSTGNLVDLGGGGGGEGGGAATARPGSPLVRGGDADGGAGSDSEAAPIARSHWRRGRRFSSGSGGGGGSSSGGGGFFSRRRASRAAAAAGASGGGGGSGGSGGGLAEVEALEGRLAPLLVVMAHPYAPFLAGLARFRRRITVANIK